MRVLRLMIDAGVELAHEGRSGLTALIAASQAGEVECVRLLISAHAGSVDHESKLGTTALIEACRHGHVAVARLLLCDGGASAEYETSLGTTALIEAAIDPLLDDQPDKRRCILEMCVREGADIDLTTAYTPIELDGEIFEIDASYFGGAKLQQNPRKNEARVSDSPPYLTLYPVIESFAARLSYSAGRPHQKDSVANVSEQTDAVEKKRSPQEVEATAKADAIIGKLRNDMDVKLTFSPSVILQTALLAAVLRREFVSTQVLLEEGANPCAALFLAIRMSSESLALLVSSSWLMKPVFLKAAFAYSEEHRKACVHHAGGGADAHAVQCALEDRVADLDRQILYVYASRHFSQACPRRNNHDGCS